MLLDFTVENYRSIKEPVTLSAIAQKPSRRKTSESSKRKGIKSDHEIAPGYYVEGWDIEVLPVLAIFGANASGKSNVIQALDYLLMMMSPGIHEIKAMGVHKLIKYAKLDPFKLDSIYAQKSTKFELRTLFDDNIYTYSLEINQHRVISEKLDYSLHTTKRTRRLFYRQWDENSKKFIWKIGSDFSGPHNQLQSSIKETELFISILIQLEINIVKKLFNWIKTRNPGVNLGIEKLDLTTMNYVIQQMKASTSNIVLKECLKIIQQFDTGLSRIELRKKFEEDFEYNIYAVHTTHEGDEIEWLLDEESLGTQRLLYWAFQIVITLNNVGRLIIVDELGTNIHPNIVKYIIKMFQNPKTNPKNAQLIFTSHDNTLQRNNLLRRDQIWFTQKRPDHSTELYPLTDFHVRNDLAIDKAYLDGRFGAVPFLPSDETMILQGDEECPES
ncbi:MULTISPECIES: ATP-binding protein [unclassified Sphaerospermopsis]|uniref:AAA family ATPase n=1 Tax=unclassified Sphaerospermopsis TaxID=2646443 RepID=UPI0016810D00|nr:MULTISPECIES: ATP-binding protein [unclassified Sphaerospermopsis]MBD2133815.1 ATP-binding protein [Sphaerospermopsis sp. FACHB-1094]MBD2144137.1 ATP-binding protein [Sphaerospermopsis sp. FACHB-1194]